MELALAGITEMAAANGYLRDHYLPAFNAEFARRPKRRLYRWVGFAGKRPFILLLTDYGFLHVRRRGGTDICRARAFAASEGQRISTVHLQVNQDSESILIELAENGAGHFVPDRGSILANVMLSLP